MRADVVLLLREAGAYPSDIPLLTDISEECLRRFASSGQLRVTLTDHNVLCHRLAFLEGCVEEIVDHHRDAGLYPTAAREIAFNTASNAGIGSTCSIVAERLAAAAASGALCASAASSAAVALAGVVALDCVNFDPAAGKATARDVGALDLLRPLLPASCADVGALYARLEAAKFDPTFWAALPAAARLRFDMKRFDGPSCAYGASTVLMTLQGANARALLPGATNPRLPADMLQSDSGAVERFIGASDALAAEIGADVRASPPVAGALVTCRSS
jgi:hypothetical protein